MTTAAQAEQIELLRVSLANTVGDAANRAKQLLSTAETAAQAATADVAAAVDKAKARIAELATQIETAASVAAAAQVRVEDSSKATEEMRSKLQAHLEEASSLKSEVATAAQASKEQLKAATADATATKQSRASAETLVAETTTARTAADEARRTAEADQKKTGALAVIAAEIEKRLTEYEAQLKALHTTEEKRLQDLHSGEEERLRKLSESDEERVKALLARIEGLLPGATSAGLAAAFNERKAELIGSQRRWAVIFAVALGIFVIAVGISTGILDFPGVPYVPMIDLKLDWREQAVHMLRRFVFVGPALWFAIFANRRYNTLVRLEEEYAHKVAMSKSFEGYKRELATIPPEAATLHKHSEALIEALRRSPVRLYDRRQQSDTPLETGADMGMRVLASLKDLKDILKRIGL